MSLIDDLSTTARSVLTELGAAHRQHRPRRARQRSW